MKMDHGREVELLIMKQIMKHFKSPSYGDTIDWSVQEAIRKCKDHWPTWKYGPLCEGCHHEAAQHFIDANDMADIRKLREFMLTWLK